jgi:hypothetical protein
MDGPSVVATLFPGLAAISVRDKALVVTTPHSGFSGRDVGLFDDITFDQISSCKEVGACVGGWPNCGRGALT